MTASSKTPTKLFPNFCPEIFCSFLGASLRYYLLSPRKPKKLPGSPQETTKISGQKSRNNFVGILEETIIS